MTEQQAIEKLALLAKRGQSMTYADAVTSHRVADWILISFLRQDNHNDLAAAWEEAREKCWLPYGG